VFIRDTIPLKEAYAVKTLSQKIELLANDKVRERLHRIVQPGTIMEVINQELNLMIADAINACMEQERDQFLGRASHERSSQPLYRNGFKKVSVPGLLGRLFLKKPDVRQGSFSSPLLQAIKQAGRDLVSLLATRFWLKGASTRAVAQELNAAFGTRLSHTTVSTLTDALEPTIQEWENRPIPDNLCYLFLDATYLPVKRLGHTSSNALFAALGVDPDGKRHILGFMLGERESLDAWQGFLKELIRKGLNPSRLRLVLSDEHKSIEHAVRNCLGRPHQLCLVHKLRNLKYRVPSSHWKAFFNDFKAIYWASSREEALKSLGTFRERWGKLLPKATVIALDRFDDFTRFMAEPIYLWRSLRSTNFIERFFGEIKRRFRSAGAMHSDLEVMKLAWAVSVAQEERWGNKRIWFYQGGDLEKVAA